MSLSVERIQPLNLVRISNVFLLDGGQGARFLVDCGHWVERPALVFELSRRGLRPEHLDGVLLTHRHSDHAGNARWLRNLGVKVYAHRKDAEILGGTRERQRLDPRVGPVLAGVLAAVENALPAPGLVVDEIVEHGDMVGELEVHWVPGHTEGSVFFRHPETESLFSGDSLLTALPPLVLRRGFALAYPTFSVDRAEVLASVQAFHAQAHGYQNLFPGHGRALLGGARARVLEFLADQGLGIPAD